MNSGPILPTCLNRTFRTKMCVRVGSRLGSRCTTIPMSALLAQLADLLRLGAAKQDRNAEAAARTRDSNSSVPSPASTTTWSALSERGGDIDRGIADRRRVTPAAGKAPGARRTNGYGGRGLRG